MAIDLPAYHAILAVCKSYQATLVAVSKTKSVEDIRALYNAGQRDFGENYVQELLEKQPLLPADIRWHFIGHLQSNKVKQIAPFVHLIHAVDSVKLLQEISKQSAKYNRPIHCLLQVHIAQEETKFGFDEEGLQDLWQQKQLSPEKFAAAVLAGFMGMASFTDDTQQVRKEFQQLKTIADQWLPGGILSMGMSADYQWALEEGSNMIRVGSLLFGTR
ncbi:MAG TPA: YggS family pyridoxal phosphate-dependent enzyme [Flavihumibacter sp.]|mgnify:CR=1 FL=1|nr:YggS family pyridoxal phosphate-dependent enzyme [Bacteroidota bacterium]HQD10519.1 YggS family pyridoxal phosphate-dependent enzyme [Flavihumibacter sp.]